MSKTDNPMPSKLTVTGAKAIAVDSDDGAGPAGEAQRLGIEVERSPTVAEQGRAASGAFDAPSAQALASPRAPRVGTKLAQAVEMLGATEGATIAELSEALDSLPHTTRAALTGLRKRGYALTLDRSDAGRGNSDSDRLMTACLPWRLPHRVSPHRLSSDGRVGRLRRKCRFFAWPSTPTRVVGCGMESRKSALGPVAETRLPG